ncbi:hypothetical protein SAMN02800694_0700 [Luteibacter sp. UNCMF331Sha3.1]|nr:hypothetical protein SAMN02800694_0700 [Luteibacter sp. UNCMF331Sha3.1]
MATYSLAVGVLAFAWATLQRVFVSHARMGPTVSTYLVTQAYKYVPGGILQYVGRHVALRKQGLTHASLALCAFAEVACLTAVASAASASFAARFGILLPPVAIYASILSFVCLAVITLGVMRLRVNWVRQRLPTFHAGWLVMALGLYVVFFLLMGLTLLAVAPSEQATRTPFATWTAVAAASWMAGFVVIGAPAGLGVREAVFVTLLSGMASQPAILLTAMCFRLATFGGDVTAYVAGMLWAAFTRRDGGAAADP